MIYRFETTELNTVAKTLSRDGKPINCEPKVYAMLQLLLENNDRVLSKDELIEIIWNGNVVSDGAVTSCINAARRAIGDDGRSQRLIATLSKRGFRFVGQDLVSQQPFSAAHENGASAAPSIAVLPFRNQSSEPGHEDLADGMLEDLVMMLSRLRWLKVINTETMRSFRQRSQKMQDLSMDLDVRYMLSGSLRSAGDRFRISLQLYDCENNCAIWADLLERKLDNLFDLQDEIILRVTGSVEHELSQSEQIRAERTRAENLDAWKAYQSGIRLIRQGVAASNLDVIRGLMEQAISLDPSFALAYAGRSFVEYWAVVEGLGEANMELGFNYARRAVELDPLEPFAHQALASLHWADRNWQSSLTASKRAIELNPSFSWAHHLMGLTYTTVGETKHARDHLLKAIDLSPRDTLIGIYYACMALSYLVDRDLAECLKWGRRAIAYPQPRWVHIYVLSALGHSGEEAEAREIRTLISKVRPEFTRRYIAERFQILSGEDKAFLLNGLRMGGLS